MNNWKRNKPTEEGWYWAKESEDTKPYVVYIDKGLNVFRDSLSRDLEKISFWSDKITSPEDEL